MNKDQLKEQFESMTPNVEQKDRMRNNILSGISANPRPKRFKRRHSWLSVSAACLALVLVITLVLPLGGESSAFGIHIKLGEEETIRLANHDESAGDSSTSISKVDARPGLEFYVEGNNIAKIEITAENEYLSARDWTETQHEKYWNVEYYQTFDEESQTSTLYPDRKYDKSVVMTFDEDFDEYGEIWYRWSARNLHEWASEDNFSRFLGYGISLEDVDLQEKLDSFENLSEQEKTELASGQNSGLGHIQLDDYPEHLLEDQITITVTDWEGVESTQTIFVKVNNNELRQTVVTARLAN